MKQPIVPSSGIPGLADTLLAFIGQLRDAKCEAESQGLAIIEVDDEITVQAELTAAGGINAIRRVSTSNSGLQVKRETVPAITETSISGEEITVEESTPTTSKDTSTRESDQYTVNGTSGGDTVTTDQTIEAG